MTTTTETPAAQLRAAAARLRELANGATSGTWAPSIVTVPAGVTHFADPAHDVAMVRSVTAKVALCSTPGDAEYMASMHPPVALAVADWLEDVARDADDLLKLDTPECAHDGGDCYCRPMAPEWGCDRCGEYLTPGACTYWDKALAVARTYLGESDGPHDH